MWEPPRRPLVRKQRHPEIAWRVAQHIPGDNKTARDRDMTREPNDLRLAVVAFGELERAGLVAREALGGRHSLRHKTKHDRERGKYGLRRSQHIRTLSCRRKGIVWHRQRR